MPDTYISKKIKKIISDTSEKINQPLADIKRLEYSLDKASKQGTLTKTDLGSLKGQVLKIRRASDAIDITPIDKVLDTTKTTVDTIAAGKKAALLAGSVMNPSFGASTQAIKNAETMLESSDTALEFGYTAKDGLVQDAKEVENILPKLALKIEAYEEFLEGSQSTSDRLHESEWPSYVARGEAHSFYGLDMNQGKSRRDWVHRDPEKYKIVLEHAELAGMSDIFHAEGEDWALNQRVDAEIALNDLVRKWWIDKIRWKELDQKVIERIKERDAAGFGTIEWDELSALNAVNLDEMEVLQGNIVDYKSDYDAWESVLLSLSTTSPQDRLVSGAGSIRSGRITQAEYNYALKPRQKDLLDRSVGATIDLAWNSVYVRAQIQGYVREASLSGPEIYIYDFRTQFSSVSSSDFGGYEVHLNIMTEEGDDPRGFGNIAKQIFIIINRYGTSFAEESQYDPETGTYVPVEGATIEETWQGT